MGKIQEVWTAAYSPGQRPGCRRGAGNISLLVGVMAISRQCLTSKIDLTTSLQDGTTGDQDGRYKSKRAQAQIFVSRCLYVSRANITLLVGVTANTVAQPFGYRVSRHLMAQDIMDKGPKRQAKWGLCNKGGRKKGKRIWRRETETLTSKMVKAKGHVLFCLTKKN